MKKALSLLLALVMCLSLCACGGGEEEAPTEAETVSNDPPAAAITDHPLLPNVYGEWLLTDTEHPENYPYASAIINEDGTVIVDGEELVWRIYEEYTKESSLTLYFYRGSEKVVGAMYDEAGWLGPLSADGAMYPSAYANRATATPEQLRAADPDTYAMPLICGTWLLTEEEEGMPREIVLNEDYTCTVDGVSHTWTMTVKNSGRDIDVEILNGSTVAHSVYITNYNSEYALLYPGEEWNVRGEYANPAHYEIIEITPENWLEYFEVVHDLRWKLDAFEEVQELDSFARVLQLKEEYASKMSSLVSGGNLLTKNAMEIEFSLGYQPCDVDLENKTIAPHEGEYTFERQMTETYKFWYDYSGADYAVSLIWSSTYSEDPNHVKIPYVYDLKLVRADCPLYLIKDEYHYVVE